MAIETKNLLTNQHPLYKFFISPENRSLAKSLGDKRSNKFSSINEEFCARVSHWTTKLLPDTIHGSPTSNVSNGHHWTAPSRLWPQCRHKVGTQFQRLNHWLDLKHSVKHKIVFCATCYHNVQLRDTRPFALKNYVSERFSALLQRKRRKNCKTKKTDTRFSVFADQKTKSAENFACQTNEYTAQTTVQHL